MKKSWKKWVLIFISIIVVAILSVAAYFYFALSGNPIVMWQTQRSVVKIYEDKYNEPFSVIDSNYDYKRHEYKVKLAPKSALEYEFRTTVYEAQQIDLYARTRTLAFLREQITEVMGFDYSDLEYSFNIFEEYSSLGLMEMDLEKRLSLNDFTVDFSFDVPKIDKIDLDAIFLEIRTKIVNTIDIPIGNMIIRFWAYDGVEYYFSEMKLMD